MSGPFDSQDAAALAELIAQHPLAWIVPRAAPEWAAMMPMLYEGGDSPALIGHLPKAHPIAAALADDRRCLFLFTGPHAYISPEWLTGKDWAPTWNFAVARLEADVSFDDSLTEEALQRLVARMEAGRAAPWTTEAMGPRYALLRERVIGFRAAITRSTPRFKLGQDERPQVFAEILRGLGDHPLAQWMRRLGRSAG
jgi:transcriptional regulator